MPLALLDQDSNVVAFTNVRFIDEGTTAWIEGTRVHPDHRNKNLGVSVIFDLMSDLISENRPRSWSIVKWLLKNEELNYIGILPVVITTEVL